MAETLDLLYAATKLVTESRFGSPSMIRRCLRQDRNVHITCATAENLLNQMQECGVVGPNRGALARDVLMDYEQACAALQPVHGSSWEGPSELWGVLHPESGTVLPVGEAGARHLVACNDDRRLVRRETPDSAWVEVHSA